MYHVRDYLAMLSDEHRVAAYARAIEAQVKPDDRVIELGAGFGFFSVLAARTGAAMVDAVDLNPVVHLGPRIAAASGCADRIRFHHMDSLEFVPGTPADVIIADLRGPTPFAGRSLEVVIDARTRMLREGGHLIARKDVLRVAPARHPAAFRRLVAGPLARTDVNLRPAAAVVTDTPFHCTIAADDLAGPAAAWGELDYEHLETASHSGTAEWRFAGPAQVEGLAIWFDADLGAGIAFSSGPGGAAATYGQLYLPLRTPVNVRIDECLQVELAARHSAGEYLWTWRVVVSGHDGIPRVSCSQNSLAERVIDPRALETAAL